MLCLVTVMSNSLQPHELQPPGSSVHGDSPGKDTGVVAALLQGIFPTQASNPHLLCLLHWQAGSLPLEWPETLVVESRGLLSSCGGFSLRWPLLLQGMGSRARTSVLGRMGFLALRHVGSSQTRDRTCVPSIGRRIPNHWTTREVLKRSLCSLVEMFFFSSFF